MSDSLPAPPHLPSPNHPSVHPLSSLFHSLSFSLPPQSPYLSSPFPSLPLSLLKLPCPSAWTCLAAGGWVTSPRPGRPRCSSHLDWTTSRFLPPPPGPSLPLSPQPPPPPRRRHTTSPALQSRLAFPANVTLKSPCPSAWASNHRFSPFWLRSGRSTAGGYASLPSSLPASVGTTAKTAKRRDRCP